MDSPGLPAADMALGNRIEREAHHEAVRSKGMAIFGGESRMNNELLTFKNLEAVLKARGGAVKLLRSSALGPYVFPVVPPEYTNWRTEQQAWKNDCALLDLSFHMRDLYLTGPDVMRLLTKVGLNKFGDFPKNRGKQIIAASHDGYMIGDGICFHTSDDVYRVVGPPMISDWVQFHAETGGYNVKVEPDEAITVRGGDPKIYIYQIQGPQALKLMSDVTDGKLPEIGFFHIGEFEIQGRPVRALRHGMAGAPGFELFGPWKDHQAVLHALENAGEKYHLRKVGALAYPTTTLESGWMPLPCPAIYHSEEMRPYREWMTPMHLEVLGSLGGSLESDNIVDYYMDPIEIGYGQFIDFNKDFIGKDALAQKIKQPKRKKVTLVWNEDDVTQLMRASLYPTDGRAGKFMNMPLAVYSTFQYDEVTKGGKRAGISQYVGYSSNAKAMLSLSIVNLEYSEPGTEVTVRWGEPNTRRPTVEKNVVHEIRAKVAPAPFFQKLIKEG
jgi:vanillate/3-O-methylgallate O-demethylase